MYPSIPPASSPFPDKVMCYLDALNALCCILFPDIPTFGDKKTEGCSSSCDFSSCLKICDLLAQQDKFSTTLWSHLVICKVNKLVLEADFYSISDNKYNKFDSFKENKKREVLKREWEDENDP